MSLSRKLAKLILSGKVTLASVVELLAKYKMLSLLPSIKQALLQMSLVKGRQDKLVIESPFPLSESALKTIQEMVGDKDVECEITINKNILAGFKAKYKGLLYDGSAERIIKQLSTR